MNTEEEYIDEDSLNNKHTEDVDSEDDYKEETTNTKVQENIGEDGLIKELESIDAEFDGKPASGGDVKEWGVFGVKCSILEPDQD